MCLSEFKSSFKPGPASERAGAVISSSSVLVPTTRNWWDGHFLFESHRVVKRQLILTLSSPSHSLKWNTTVVLRSNWNRTKITLFVVWNLLNLSANLCLHARINECSQILFYTLSSPCVYEFQAVRAPSVQKKSLGAIMFNFTFSKIINNPPLPNISPA